MNNTMKKLLSLLLCAVMLCSLLPVSAFAGEDPGTQGEITAVSIAITPPEDGTTVAWNEATNQSPLPAASVADEADYTLAYAYYWSSDDSSTGTYRGAASVDTYSAGSTFYIKCALQAEGEHYFSGEISTSDITVPSGITVKSVSQDCIDTAPCLIVMLSGTVASHSHNEITFGKLGSSYTGFPGGVLKSGNYFLTEDINLINNITIPAGNTVNICLNGHTLTGNGSGSVITNNGTLTIYDCSSGQTGSITGGYSKYGGGIYNTGTLTIAGGSITGNKTKVVKVEDDDDYYYEGGLGGGVYNAGTMTVSGGCITANEAEYTYDGWYRGGCGGGIFNAGTLTVSGGSITNGEAIYGTGIYNEKTMYVTGGSITGNTAFCGGGIYCQGKYDSINMEYAACTLEISAGSVSGNTAQCGGGIYAYTGTCTISGTASVSSNNAIVKNSSGGYGGGIYVDYYATLEISGGMVEKNTAECGGGGISAGGSFNMTAGSICNNKAGDNSSADKDDYYYLNGGGVYIWDGVFNFSGGTISANTAAEYGGGICVGYLNYDATFNMGGSASVLNNTAEYGGGGIFADDGETVNLLGGEIKGNKVNVSNISGFDYIAGGVGAQYNCKLTLGGNIVITDNTDKDGKANNLMLDGSNKGTVAISTGKPLDNGAEIGVNLGAEGAPISFPFVIGENCQETDAQYFTSDLSALTVAYNSTGGVLQLEVLETAKISKAALSVAPVVAGTVVKSSGEADQILQDAAPSVTIDDGEAYKLYSAQNGSYCYYWNGADIEDRYFGKIEDQEDSGASYSFGDTFYIMCMLQAKDGRIFSSDIDVNDIEVPEGITVESVFPFNTLCYVIVSGKVVDTCSLTVGETVTWHHTVQAAIDAAGTSEGTVSLLKDCTGGIEGTTVASGQNITLVASGQNITLDLNGHTLGGYYKLIQNNGTLTIADSSESQVGKISGERDIPDVTAIINTGILIFQNGNIKVLADNSIGICNTGTVTINGGSIQVDGDTFSHCIESSGSGKVIIHGGSFRAISTYGDDTSTPSVLYTDGESSSIEVDGGSFTGAVNAVSGTITLSGGIFSQKPDDSYLAEGYEVISNPDSATSGDYPYAVVPIGIPLSGEFKGSFFADGEPVEKEVIGGITYVKVPGSSAKVLTYYEYTTGTGEGTEEQRTYPVSMKVWFLSYDAQSGKYTATEFTELENALTYCGTSIRTSGNKGIRVITGINETLKNQLIAGLKGWTLTEYGTVIAWTSQLGTGGLTLEASGAQHNYAYSKAAGTDPVFNKASGMVQYTNVLILKDLPESAMGMDITMRPYMKLTDSQGNEIVVYGGEIVRSIGYVAYQNRNEFNPGTSEYKYIWAMIHAAYGDTYDSEYKVK